MNITHVVIPAAGFGTRFLPITKSVPKEMLPLLNRPALEYTVQEARESGISHCCIVINKEKTLIPHYFSHDEKLEKTLESHKKLSLLSDLNSLIDSTKFSYVIQPEMRGLGHAISLTRETVENNFFAVMLPDDIIFHTDPGIGQLIAMAQRMNASIVAVVEVPREEISAYGCIKVRKTINDSLAEIEDVIEKPKPEEAFSNLAIIGRYVFSPAIFDALSVIKPHTNGEIQLTDAITHLAKTGHRILAYKIKGNRFDLGRPHGWLAANNYLFEHTHR